MNIEIIVTNHIARHLMPEYPQSFSARLKFYTVEPQYGATPEEAIGKLMLKLVREEFISGIEIPDWMELT